MKDKYIGTIIRDYKIIDCVSTEKGKEKRYKVKCVHCGLEREYNYQNLLKGKKEINNNCICTCSLSGIKPGDKFGRLTVIKRDLKNQVYGRVSWLCKCECGNEVVVIGKNLKNGNTRSCGCLVIDTSKNNLKPLLENLEDLTLQTQGRLTVIRLATEEEYANKPKGLRYWLCECECGNKTIVSTSDFKMGKVSSCGCLKSKGESYISKILRENNISFAKQYYFNDLKSKQGSHYFFDFGIIDSYGKLLYLIEYDGIQHFDKNHQFGNKEETLKNIQERDKIKNNYCLEHKIPLIRIPYTYLSKINIIDLKLETSSFVERGD